MLGETGTEQFTISIFDDEKQISEQKLHDPFIRTTIIVAISRWDLFKAMFRRQFKKKLNVNLNASEGMMRAIMMLNPGQIEEETKRMLKARAESRANSQCMGYVAQDSCSK